MGNRWGRCSNAGTMRYDDAALPDCTDGSDGTMRWAVKLYWSFGYFNYNKCDLAFQEFEPISGLMPTMQMGLNHF